MASTSAARARACCIARVRSGRPWLLTVSAGQRAARRTAAGAERRMMVRRAARACPSLQACGLHKPVLARQMRRRREPVLARRRRALHTFACRTRSLISTTCHRGVERKGHRAHALPSSRWLPRIPAIKFYRALASLQEKRASDREGVRVYMFVMWTKTPDRIGSCYRSDAQNLPDADPCRPFLHNWCTPLCP